LSNCGEGSAFFARGRYTLGNGKGSGARVLPLLHPEVVNINATSAASMIFRAIKNILRSNLKLLKLIRQLTLATAEIKIEKKADVGEGALPDDSDLWELLDD
jgi:hypothetical protein